MPEYQKLVYFPDEQGDWFDRAHTYSTTPGFNGWTTVLTGTTPTAVNNDGGGFTGACNAANEAQLVVLYQKDMLAFDVDELQYMEFFAKVAGVDAVTTIVLGLASAHNTTLDSVATNAWFRMQGSASTSNLLCESDDGTLDLDDKATGTTLADTLKKFHIDFTNGKDDVRFFVNDARVSPTVTFDIGAATGKVQPYFAVAKASGTGTPSISVQGVKVCTSKSLS